MKRSIRQASRSKGELVEGARHPPLPAAVFRVGITGHRPNRLHTDKSSLVAQLTRVLAEVRAEVFSLTDASAGFCLARRPGLDSEVQDWQVLVAAKAPNAAYLMEEPSGRQGERKWRLKRLKLLVT